MKKTTSEPTNTRLKNVLLSGNDRGGVGKTFNNTQLGDALEALGYNINYVDADPGSTSLREIIPNAKTLTIATNLQELDGNTEKELDRLFTAIANDPEWYDNDLTIVDFGAGTTAATLGLYFKKKRGRQIFDEIGIRLLAAISINSDDESLKCSMPWVKALGTVAEFITLASHEKQLPLDIHNLPSAESLLRFCGGRVIEFQRLSPALLEHYGQIKGRAGDYIEGGPLAEVLNLAFFDTAGWNNYRIETILSVYPHAEWLTGRKAPNPPHPSLLVEDPKQNEVNETLANMEKLRADKKLASKGNKKA